MNSRLSDETLSTVFSRILRTESLIGEIDTATIFYDLSFLDERINNLIALFPETTLHAIAIKATPLIGILKYINRAGVGLESASLPELYLAREAGYNNNRIVFDSPVKTILEIKEALDYGVHINADSFFELDRIAAIINSHKNNCNSTIGIRINPQIGIGKITGTSVAAEYSKFGIPLNTNREKLMDYFVKYKWLRGVHVHIGSQGCPYEMLIEGVSRIYNFAMDVNNILDKENPKRKINIFDIGGGLPVSYHKGKNVVSMSQYVNALKNHFNELFDGDFKLITEFGRYIYANCGWVATRVEYVKREANINTAMIHTGADLFLRKCYRPEDWHHEILVLDHNGHIKKGFDENNYNIAGPLCFAGDFIGTNLNLPRIEEGDYLIIQDTGAYTLSMWSRYNSRQIPQVIGYINNGEYFYKLKQRETLDNILNFWS